MSWSCAEREDQHRRPDGEGRVAGARSDEQRVDRRPKPFATAGRPTCRTRIRREPAPPPSLPPVVAAVAWQRGGGVTTGGAGPTRCAAGPSLASQSGAA
jgi:hypothetical protein